MSRKRLALIRWACAHGLRCELRRSGHWRIHTPAGWVGCPSTPSDPRSMRNARSTLRQYLRASGWDEAVLRRIPCC